MYFDIFLAMNEMLPWTRTPKLCHSWRHPLATQACHFHRRQ